MKKKEYWKQYDDKYLISNFGNVKRIDGKSVKLSDNGYYHISWGPKIYRMVAEAFIPNPEHKKYVNHIDGNKHNDRVDNLEWCTNSENVIHAYKNGLINKENISIAQKNRTDRHPLSKETKSKISNTLKNNHPTKGKHLSDERRKKISKSNKNKKRTHEQIENYIKAWEKRKGGL